MNSMNSLSQAIDEVGNGFALCEPNELQLLSTNPAFALSVISPARTFVPSCARARVVASIAIVVVVIIFIIVIIIITVVIVIITVVIVIITVVVMIVVVVGAVS